MVTNKLSNKSKLWWWHWPPPIWRSGGSKTNICEYVYPNLLDREETVICQLLSSPAFPFTKQATHQIETSRFSSLKKKQPSQKTHTFWWFSVNAVVIVGPYTAATVKCQNAPVQLSQHDIHTGEEGLWSQNWISQLEAGFCEMPQCPLWAAPPSGQMTELQGKGLLFFFKSRDLEEIEPSVYSKSHCSQEVCRETVRLLTQQLLSCFFIASFEPFFFIILSEDCKVENRLWGGYENWPVSLEI